MRRVIGAVSLSYLLVFFSVLVVFLRLGGSYHREWALVLMVLSWVPLAVAGWKRRRLLRIGRKRLSRHVRPYWLHGVVAALLLVVVYIVRVLAPDSDTTLLSMGGAERSVMMKHDKAALIALRANLRTSLELVEESPLTYLPVAEMTADDRATIRGFWSGLLTQSLELDTLMRRYRCFPLIDHVGQRELHTEAFVLAYGAFVTQFRAFLELVELADDRPFLETMMDEAWPEHGIPAGSYSFMKVVLTHPDALLRLNAGHLHAWLLDLHGGLWQEVESDRAWIVKQLRSDPTAPVDRALDIFEKRISELLVPVQKGVAVQLSLLRGTDRPFRIEGDLLLQAREMCLPGDILLERRSWQATNAGIPGFWPHSALYIGTPEERRELFGRDVEQEFDAAVPGVARRLQSLREDGAEPRVIEALREGVVLNSFESSANADYVAVLRPRVSPEAKRKAIQTALRYLGCPYDYNFDYATDGALVCSELVSKAYSDVDGISLAPTVRNGRLLLPTNMIARKYALSAEGEQRELDFVLFVDSSEKSGKAWLASESDFRQTWKRPKWEVLAD